MSPAVFVDSSGDVRLVVGAAGGTMITSSVAWTAMNNLWLGKDIKEAIDARRIHHQLLPMILSYEDGTLSVSCNSTFLQIMDCMCINMTNKVIRSII